MSIISQELLRKISTKSHDNTRQTHSSEIQKKTRFRELMKVSAVDDAPKEKHPFSLFEEENEESVEVPAAISLQLRNDAASAQDKLASVTSLSEKTIATLTEMEALFERIASTMILLCSSEEKKTTFFLDHPHFASSTFFGSTITIREFSTAPKTFNIEIATSVAGMAILEANKQGLLSAFEKGHFNFSVHRFETCLQPQEDRPVLQRKENQDSGDSHEQKGGQE